MIPCYVSKKQRDNLKNFWRTSVTRTIDAYSSRHIVRCPHINNVETFLCHFEMTISCTDITRDVFWFPRYAILLI
jgi:hypothetical protein